MNKTYTIGEIMERYNLETPGDAWELVIDSGWKCERPIPGDERSGPWRITIPEEE